MPDDLTTVLEWARKNGPANVENAACRLLNEPAEGSFRWLLKQVLAERDDAHALLHAALHLRTHGEHAPGGTENWQNWERAAEDRLRTHGSHCHNPATRGLVQRPDGVWRHPGERPEGSIPAQEDDGDGLTGAPGTPGPHETPRDAHEATR